MKSEYDCEKDDATIQTAFINEMTMRTLRLPTVSAILPQTYAPTIMPINMIEFSHPFVCVFKSRSHCAEGKMKDIEITSISSLVLTKPQIANRI